MRTGPDAGAREVRDKEERRDVRERHGRDAAVGAGSEGETRGGLLHGGG